MLGGLGDGELGVGLDGVAQGGVLLVALGVGLLQRRGLEAGAVLLEGRVLLLESRAVPKAANTYEFNLTK